MKKLIAFLLVVSVLLSLCACKTSNKADDSGKTSPSASPLSSIDDEGIDGGVAADEDFMVVYDKNGNLLTVAVSSSPLTMTDYGIVGSRKDGDETDYFLLDALGEETFLWQKGMYTVKKQSYETFYSRVECNGCLYTLACVGDALKGETVELYLVEIDLKNGTGSQYLVSDNGYYYGALCAVEGKIIMFFHDQKENGLYDRVKEFDPFNKRIEEKLTFELNNDLVGESVRYVFDYGYFFGVLTLEYNGSNDVKMIIKVYNKFFMLVEEYDVTSAVKAAAGAYLDAADVNNELIQHVANAFILDQKYFYYENFSATRCLFDIYTGKQVATLSGLFTSSSGSGRPLFTNVYEGTTYYELSEGALVSNTFTPKTAGVITGISRSPNGTKLIRVKTPDKSDPDLYCIT